MTKGLQVPRFAAHGFALAGLVLAWCAACSTHQVPPQAPEGAAALSIPPAPQDSTSPEAAPLRVEAEQELIVLRCDAEPSLRSIKGDAPVVVQFSNLRADAVELFWLDYDGQRKSYGLLSAGATREQRTYLSHPWLIASTSGACLEIRAPRAQRATIR